MIHDLAKPVSKLLSVPLLAAIIAGTGCGGESDGPPAVPVSGVLTVDGKPVAQGTVHLHPEKGRAASGIVKDGKFTLTTYRDGDGAIAGKANVALKVTQDVPTPDGDTDQKSLIPRKFTLPDTSGLGVEIPAGGTSNLQIEIQGESGTIKAG